MQPEERPDTPIGHALQCPLRARRVLLCSGRIERQPGEETTKQDDDKPQQDYPDQGQNQQRQHQNDESNVSQQARPPVSPSCEEKRAGEQRGGYQEQRQLNLPEDLTTMNAIPGNMWPGHVRILARKSQRRLAEKPQFPRRDQPDDLSASSPAFRQRLPYLPPLAGCTPCLVVGSGLTGRALPSGQSRATSIIPSPGAPVATPPAKPEPPPHI